MILLISNVREINEKRNVKMNILFVFLFCSIKRRDRKNIFIVKTSLPFSCVCSQSIRSQKTFNLDIQLITVLSVNFPETMHNCILKNNLKETVQIWRFTNLITSILPNNNVHYDKNVSTAEVS